MEAIEAYSIVTAALKHFRSDDSIQSDNDELFLDEAVKFTGLKKSYIYKLTCLGLIPYTKHRKKLVFSKAALIKWLKPNEKGVANVS